MYGAGNMQGTMTANMCTSWFVVGIYDAVQV